MCRLDRLELRPGILYNVICVGKQKITFHSATPSDTGLAVDQHQTVSWLPKSLLKVSIAAARCVYLWSETRRTQTDQLGTRQVGTRMPVGQYNRA